MAEMKAEQTTAEDRNRGSGSVDNLNNVWYTLYYM
jgi:hypothetical protein